MSKRTTAFILAVSLISSLFFGCGTDPAETQPPTELLTEAPVLTETTPPTEEPEEEPTEKRTEPATEAPTEMPTEPPTEVTTEPPTEAPTEPAETFELSTKEIILTKQGEQVEIYCGTVPVDQISWLSDDESVALFSQGTVVALNPGTVMIYAVYRDQTISCQVTCDVEQKTSKPYVPGKLLHAPRLALPYVEDMDDTSFFDDAAFIGDSVSHVLQQWHIKNGSFGKAVFLTRNSLGLQNTIDGRMKLFYQGKSLSPEEAVAKSGVKKLFVMLGLNDVGLYGVDGALERWDIFLGRILDMTPDLQIYIQSCTSIHHEGEMKSYSNALFDEYNAALAAYCEEKGYHFVNIAPYFKDYSNAMPTIYSSDKFVHMSYEGTAAWEQVLKAYAAEQKGETQ